MQEELGPEVVIDIIGVRELRVNRWRMSRSAPDGIDSKRQPRQPTAAASDGRTGTAPISKHSALLDVNFRWPPPAVPAAPATIFVHRRGEIVERENVGGAVAETRAAGARAHRHLIELVSIVGCFTFHGHFSSA